jgi:hypothetical protein
MGLQQSFSRKSEICTFGFQGAKNKSIKTKRKLTDWALLRSFDPEQWVTAE